MTTKRWIPLFAGLLAVGIVGGAVAYGKGKGTKAKISKAKISKAKQLSASYSFSIGMGDGTLGADLQTMSGDLRKFFGAPDDHGLLVAAVEPGSAAERAGLKVGDVLLEVDGEEVAEPWDLAGPVAGKKAGDEVKLSIIRNKAKQTLSTKLTDDDVDLTMGLAGPMVQIPHMKQFGHGSGSYGLYIGSGGGVDDEVEELREQVKDLEERLQKLEKKVK